MKTEKILKFMHILSWIAFIGLCIKTGAVLISYMVSIGNPEAAKNLYLGLDLSEYYNYSFRQYTFIVSYKVALFATEAYIAYLVTKLLSTLNLEQPFNSKVQKLMQSISYSIFNLWILALVHNAHVKFIAKKNYFSMDLFSSDFIFLAGVIFIFTQIVKRGIEIQTENDLTI
ncbi:MAG: DUF2975 domain-containing protein [Polaribacter sp.]|uniref:DUF2975 domain-containing protein n=1 Tax=Polaribacter sp. TaxID=1920175 RepID=UPI003BB103D1